MKRSELIQKLFRVLDFVFDHLFQDFEKIVNFMKSAESQKLKDKYNAQTILLSRGDSMKTLGPGDSTEAILNYNYDYVIENAGDLDQLKWKAREFMEKNHLVLGREV